MLRYIQEKFFEEQLLFTLPDGSEDSSAFIGGTPFAPSEVLKEFRVAYQQELSSWLNELWTPMQHDIRSELLGYRANFDRFIDLKSAIKRGHVVPFVGSGMSVPSGLPTWSEFLLQVGGFTGCNPSELEPLVYSSQFEKAADLIDSSTNTRLLAERIKHTLRIEGPSVINGPILLLPSLFSSVVITTNLDNVLEFLYEVCDVSFAHVLLGSGIGNYRQNRDTGERYLLKLHGDHNDQSERVVLSTEYDQAYASNSALREELVLMCRNNSLLFLGCSLGNDRTVKLIEEVASADRQMPNHFALLQTPVDESDLVVREDFLTDRGVFPIWYDPPHDDAIMALLDGLHSDVVE